MSLCVTQSLSAIIRIARAAVRGTLALVRRQVLDVNLMGTFFFVRACLPRPEASGKGGIEVTSSITGSITGYPGWSHYAARKVGQPGFIRSAALELAPHHVTVNAVLSGNIRTEGVEALGEKYLSGVEDVAYTALLSAGDEAAFVTGPTMVVNGGQVHLRLLRIRALSPLETS